MSLHSKAEYSALAILIFSFLLSACVAATQTSTSTLTPSATAIMTVRPSPTSTSTPIPIPGHLLDQKILLEENGFVFNKAEITHKDEAGKEWDVIRFINDGGAVIKTLDNNFQGIEETLTTEQVRNLSIETLNAGHDWLFVFKNEDSGKVEKIFLPKVVYSIPQPDGTVLHEYASSAEAGWATPIEISDDFRNPTKVSNIEEFHTGLVLKSTQLKMNGVPWSEEDLPIRFYYNAGAQFLSHPAINDKFSSIEIRPEGQHWNYKGITGREAGFLEYTINGERILISQTESLVDEDSETLIFSIGFSGEILTYRDNNGDLLLEKEIIGFDKAKDFLLYQALGNNVRFLPASVRYMKGVETLYQSNPNNQPWKLFPELVDQLEKIESGNIGVGVFIDKEKLKHLQYMILSYFFL